MRNTSMAAVSRLRNIIMVNTPMDLCFLLNFVQGMLGLFVMTAITAAMLNENREAVTRLDQADRVMITGILLTQTAVALWAFTAYLASAPTIIQQALHWRRGANVVRSVRPTLIYTWPAAFRLPG